MRVNSTTQTLKSYLTALILLLSSSTAPSAAEIWVESSAKKDVILNANSSSSCPLITHDCEICSAIPGGQQVICSRRPDKCMPTKWSCLNDIDANKNGAEYASELGSIHTNPSKSGSEITSKEFNDRLPENSLEDGSAAEQENLKRSQSHSKNELREIKKQQDRVDKEE